MMRQTEASLGQLEHLIEGIAAALCQNEAEVFLTALAEAEGQIGHEHSNIGNPVVIIAEPDPIRYIAGVMAGLRVDAAVFLVNPNWGLSEWQWLLGCCGKGEVIGQKPPVGLIMNTSAHEPIASGVYLATGGSSGRLRFARHTLQTLSAHVEAFQTFFNLPTVNSLCALPLYHVSGWMQVMRSGLSRGKLAFYDKETLMRSIAQLGAGNGGWFEDACLSLVPTQLQRLLQVPECVAGLRKLRAVFLGGSAPQAEWVERAVEEGIPLWLTYGMTETAAMVAAVSAAEKNLAAPLLPHTDFRIDAHQRLWLRCKSLCQGYFPDVEPFIVEEGWFRTDDLAETVEGSKLKIIGRADKIIVTGGEKVNPAEVETAILSFPGVQDCHVYGCADPEWGQRVCALVSSETGADETELLLAHLRSRLAPHKLPKGIRWVVQLPRNEAGKVEDV